MVTTLLLPVSDRVAAVAVAIADLPAAEEDVIDEDWDEDDGWEQDNSMIILQKP